MTEEEEAIDARSSASLTDDRTNYFKEQASWTANDVESSYQGIPTQSRVGLLPHVAETIRASLTPGSRILDIAAGSGGLTLQLHELGFEVEASDYVAENFRPTQIPFTRLDLNTDFSALYEKKPPFDAIVATEIIEHLENPRHFLRQIARMLRPKGYLFLTTPNVDAPVSKATMLAFGHATWFDDKNYKLLGHITPISIRTVKQAASESGFFIEKLETFGDPWEHLRTWPKLRIFAAVVSLLDRVPRNLRGDILVAMMRRE